MLSLLLIVAADPVLQFSPVEGSQYERISATVSTDAPANQQALAIWAMTAPTAKRDPLVTTHLVLENGATTRVYYEVISVPAVAQRDYVLRVSMRQVNDAYVLTYQTIEHEHYPPQPGKVRMSVHATCIVRPVDGGGSTIEYDMHTELGGRLPAWMAREPQRQSVLNAVKTMVAAGRS